MGLMGRVNRAVGKATGFELHRVGGATSAPPRQGPPVKRGPMTPWLVDPGDEELSAPPVPRAAPGSAKASMFFDNFPRFYETSQISAFQARLNLRYEAICTENRDVLAGARVLDLTSHDGRWSLAALKTGAAEVIGVEANPEHVKNAETNLAEYGIEKSRYRFITSDLYEALEKEAFDVDVVFCLGYLYHTLRYNELFYRFRELQPKALIIDTQIFPDPQRALVRLRLDQVGRIFDQHSYGEDVLVGWPSLPALEMTLRAYELELERLSDWGAILRDNPDANGPAVADYATGWRITARCRTKAAG